MPVLRQSILGQIALITNKFLTLDEIHYATELVWNSSKGLLRTMTLSESSIRVSFWIAKGLILRLTQTEEVLKRLMSLLSDADFGLTCGRGFGVLLAPDKIVSKENGASIRLLAKQKVFNYCIPRIAQDIRQVEKSMKPNYLTALSGILQNMPSEILMSEIDALLPLLLQSLDLEDADVKAATIESLIIICQDNLKATEEHMTSLVNRLLRCTSNEGTNKPVGFNRQISRYLVYISLTHDVESTAQCAYMFTCFSRKDERQHFDTSPIQGYQSSDDRFGRS